MTIEEKCNEVCQMALKEAKAGMSASRAFQVLFAIKILSYTQAACQFSPEPNPEQREKDAIEFADWFLSGESITPPAVGSDSEVAIGMGRIGKFFTHHMDMTQREDLEDASKSAQDILITWSELIHALSSADNVHNDEVLALSSYTANSVIDVLVEYDKGKIFRIYNGLIEVIRTILLRGELQSLVLKRMKAAS